MEPTESTASRGNVYPLGASQLPGGVNFALFSRHAESVTLLLFESVEDQNPCTVLKLNRNEHRTGDIWHTFVPNAGPGTLYLYNVDGPYKPETGHRFNGSLSLPDPYAKAFVKDSRGQRKCVVVDESFDWQDDKPLRTPLEETIIY